MRTDTSKAEIATCMLDSLISAGSYCIIQYIDKMNSEPITMRVH